MKNEGSEKKNYMIFFIKQRCRTVVPNPENVAKNRRYCLILEKFSIQRFFRLAITNKKSIFRKNKMADHLGKNESNPSKIVIPEFLMSLITNMNPIF